MTTLEKTIAPLLLLLRKTPAQGAYSSVYAATSDELEGVGGKYIVHCEACQPSAVCYDKQQAEQLWNISAKYTQL
jgi:dehydrogenase/reductase SDR family protein X